jgi:hypothetical protein
VSVFARSRHECSAGYTGAVTVEELRQPELPDDATWSIALEDARTDQRAVLRDVALTSDLFTELIVAAGRKDDESPFELELSCYGVVFRDQLWFDDVRLVLALYQCRFDQGLHSSGTFEDTVFKDVSVADSASFPAAAFTGSTEFTRVRFDGGARFDDAQFDDVTTFSDVSFGGQLWFQGARFAASVSFDAVTSGRTDEGAADVAQHNHSYVGFNAAVFEDFVRLDITADEVVLQDVTFGQRVGGRITAGSIACDRARFSDNTRVMFRAARTSLTEVRFERPCVIACAGDLVADDAVFAADAVFLGPPGADSSRIRSLRGATVSRLTLARLDLSSCLFHEAHGLDELRIESNCTFARPPRSWRFAARRTIAEENLWRRGPWPVPEFDTWFVDNVGHPTTLDPAEIASLYRSLRKATESQKNEPGAADFYYGEMEMRRQAARRLSGERLLLNTFWATKARTPSPLFPWELVSDRPRASSPPFPRRKAGIEPARRIYDLRHTYATFSLAAGVSLFTLARRMGTSVEMIDRTYGHLAPDAEDYERGLLDAFDARSTTAREGAAR